MNKGKLDYRDLSKDASYYYDKLISDINKFVELDYNQKQMIESLDMLIRLVKDDAVEGGD